MAMAMHGARQTETAAVVVEAAVAVELVRFPFSVQRYWGNLLVRPV